MIEVCDEVVKFLQALRKLNVHSTELFCVRCEKHKNTVTVFEIYEEIRIEIVTPTGRHISELSNIQWEQKE